MFVRALRRKAKRARFRSRLGRNACYEDARRSTRHDIVRYVRLRVEIKRNGQQRKNPSYAEGFTIENDLEGHNSSVGYTDGL